MCTIWSDVSFTLLAGVKSRKILLLGRFLCKTIRDCQTPVDWMQQRIVQDKTRFTCFTHNSHDHETSLSIGLGNGLQGLTDLHLRKKFVFVVQNRIHCTFLDRRKLQYSYKVKPCLYSLCVKKLWQPVLSVPLLHRLWGPVLSRVLLHRSGR
jgi:hypothetical protein